MKSVDAVKGIAVAENTRPKYNLGYRIGGDLKEVAEDPASMQAYVDFILLEAKRIPNPPPADAVRAMVKFLGDIGAYAKILRKPDAALHALERSLALIEEHGLGARTWAVHTLRYGDALRFKRDDLASETAFRSVLEMGRRSPEAADLEDFAWQHLGKLRFDQGKIPDAEDCFQKALEIRRRRGVKELVESTELALRVLKMRKK